MEDHFKLPFTKELEEAYAANEVCVVGVFGKSGWGHTSKGCIINKLSNSSSFMPHYPDFLKHNGANLSDDVQSIMPSIECYFDKQKHILYLHLTTTLDAATLSRACALTVDKLETHSDFHDFWKNQESEIAFAILYLFSVCHVLMLVHPVSIFDISYDKLFHHISDLRTSFLPSIKDVLKGCSVGRDWWVNGRPCPPRLLLVMQRCHLPNLQPPEAQSGEGSSSKKKKPPLKRLQHTIEDQVYKILRKSHVLTNSAVNCLFTVPPNQAFVHIMTEQFERVKNDEDPVRSMLQLLRKSCETHRDPTARSRAYRLLTNPPTQWKDEENEEQEDSSNPLWTFLSQHTNLILEKKGFKDSVGRNPLPTHFEVPTLKQWLKVANNLYELFFLKKLTVDAGETSKAESKKMAQIRQDFLVQLDPESRFSEARCSKLVSLASAAYQSNLPMHYTSKVHNNQLAQALSTYSLHARGPARDKYEACVQAECEAFWNDGRRLCEVHSLTGRHCVHRFHDLPTDSKSQPDSIPPKMHHSSRSRTVAASSCGRIQGPRDDPFTLQEANYDFYLRLDVQAIPPISELDIYKFPVHERADKEPVISPALHCLVEQLHIGTEANSQKDLSGRVRHRTISGDSECQVSTQESGNDSQVEEAKKPSTQDRQRTTSANYEFSLNSETMQEVQSVDYTEEIPQRQTFTEGMIHSGLDEDVLPLFSSWSLVRLGSSSSYIPGHGLDLPGFLPGTGFLVSWDISLQGDEACATHWPVPGEARKLSLKETKLMQQEITKAYVGYEYETPRGQRFICSAPEKPVKVGNNGIVRDPIQPLLDMDMPLYCASPVSARNGKPLLGQLMRVYIITPPESNVHITIKPKVIPGPNPTPTFYPSQQEIALRHNSMWVLRFPYVYVSETGSHSPSKDLNQISAWRVLKMISIEIDR